MKIKKKKTDQYYLNHDREEKITNGNLHTTKLNNMIRKFNHYAKPEGEKKKKKKKTKKKKKKKKKTFNSLFGIKNTNDIALTKLHM